MLGFSHISIVCFCLMCLVTGFLRFRVELFLLSQEVQEDQGASSNFCSRGISICGNHCWGAEKRDRRWVDLWRVHEFRGGFLLHPLRGSLSPLFTVFYTSPGAVFFQQHYHTVDGWNPANQWIGSFSHYLYIGFHTSQVVQDFSHQQ